MWLLPSHNTLMFLDPPLFFGHEIEIKQSNHNRLPCPSIVLFCKIGTNTNLVSALTARVFYLGRTSDRRELMNMYTCRQSQEKEYFKLLSENSKKNCCQTDFVPYCVMIYSSHATNWCKNLLLLLLFLRLVWTNEVFVLVLDSFQLDKSGLKTVPAPATLALFSSVILKGHKFTWAFFTEV